MTDREKAIVFAYTGYAMLIGDKLGIFYRYIEELIGYMPYTHEFADKKLQEKIHELSKDDFIKLCKDETLGAEKEKKMNNKDYIKTMLNIIDKNIDRLIEQADDECYDKGFIERLKEMKEDVAEVKEEIVNL